MSRRNNKTYSKMKPRGLTKHINALSDYILIAVLTAELYMKPTGVTTQTEALSENMSNQSEGCDAGYMANQHIAKPNNNLIFQLTLFCSPNGETQSAFSGITQSSKQSCSFQASHCFNIHSENAGLEMRSWKARTNIMHQDMGKMFKDKDYAGYRENVQGQRLCRI